MPAQSPSVMPMRGCIAHCHGSYVSPQRTLVIVVLLVIAIESFGPSTSAKRTFNDQSNTEHRNSNFRTSECKPSRANRQSSVPASLAPPLGLVSSRYQVGPLRVNGSCRHACPPP